MGADLAVVVGTNFGGLPRYRVVLLQAKHEAEGARNRADVGQGKGSQLAELLSSGMGYYLFYPRPVQRAGDTPRVTRLLPVVRSAADVSGDVGKLRKRGRYRVNCYRNNAGVVDAIDFAQFVSIVMTDGTLDVGRIFKTPSEVADALTTPDRPMVPDVVAIDGTGLLSCHEFLYELGNRGYKVKDEFALPSAEELKADRDGFEHPVTPGSRFGISG